MSSHARTSFSSCIPHSGVSPISSCLPEKTKWNICFFIYCKQVTFSLSTLFSSLDFSSLKLSASFDFFSAFSALLRAAASSLVSWTSFSMNRDGALLLFPFGRELFIFLAVTPVDVVGSSWIKTTSLSITKRSSFGGEAGIVVTAFLDFCFSPLIGDLASEESSNLGFSSLGRVLAELLRDFSSLLGEILEAEGNKIFLEIFEELLGFDLDLDLDLAACLSDRRGLVELLVLGGD